MESTLTPQQIENNKMAYAIMAGIPAKKIDLGIYRDDGNESDRVSNRQLLMECNTSGCIAGWLSAHPHFIAQGLEWGVDGVRCRGKLHQFTLPNAAQELFGNSWMFGGGEDNLRGKKEALARIRTTLYNSMSITGERDRELAAEEKAMKE